MVINRAKFLFKQLFTDCFKSEIIVFDGIFPLSLKYRGGFGDQWWHLLLTWCHSIINDSLAFLGWPACKSTHLKKFLICTKLHSRMYKCVVHVIKLDFHIWDNAKSIVLVPNISNSYFRLRTFLLPDSSAIRYIYIYVNNWTFCNNIAYADLMIRSNRYHRYVMNLLEYRWLFVTLLFIRRYDYVPYALSETSNNFEYFT